MYNDEYIAIAKVLPQMRASTARQALVVLADAASGATGIAPRLIQNQLFAQETRQSSGIGDGIVLAHTKLRGIKKPCLVFGRLARPVSFAGVDDVPADLAFLLISPESDGPLHLRRLARLTRLVRDEALCRHLRGTEDEDTLHALLSDPVSRKLAA